MRVAIIGSGPSGIAAAAVFAEQGIPVDLFDGGEALEPPARNTAELIAEKLRQESCLQRSDMSALRFGPAQRSFGRLLYNAVTAAFIKQLPARQLEKNIFGSNFAFRSTEHGIPLHGAWMPRSLATGGLSNVWGAACYPLRHDDYIDWPLTEAELAPWYAKAQTLAGVCAAADQLEDAYPIYPAAAKLGNHATFDPGSPVESLLSQWKIKSGELRTHGLTGGRPRLAVMPPSETGAGCRRCGLCLFGCPLDAIWHADKAIPALSARSRLTHRPGAFVRHLKRDDRGLWLVTGAPDAPVTEQGPYDKVLLAAGPLSSLRIAVDSLGLTQHRCRLVENDTYVLPFRLTAPLTTSDTGPVQFALSQAVLAVEPGVLGRRPAHLQFYRITEPILGAIGQLLATLPANLGATVFRLLRYHLMALVYLHSDDSRRIEVQIDGKDGPLSRLRINATEHDHRPELRQFGSLLAAAQHATGLKPLTALARIGPPGFSGHIGGTMPLSTTPTLLQCQVDGQLEGLPNVYVVDMSVFPAMPAQNPTLTSMANAMRCAATICKSRNSE
jgi:Choline dehydrogenase and related flavoproteins